MLRRKKAELKTPQCSLKNLGLDRRRTFAVSYITFKEVLLAVVAVIVGPFFLTPPPCYI
jgi:hypothetical protein